MTCSITIAIYCYLGLQCFILLSVRGSPLSSYQPTIDILGPTSSSSSSLSSSSLSSSTSSSSDLLRSNEISSNLSPTLIGYGNVDLSSSPSLLSSASLPVKRSPKDSIIIQQHPLRFLLGQMIRNPDNLKGSYQRGRRYREHDKSFIRFGRALTRPLALAIWSKENRKRPEQMNDTYFLRFGRSPHNP